MSEEEIRAKIDAIKQKVDSLQYVSAGDYVLADHHNDVVDILKDIADVLQQIPITKIIERVEYKPLNINAELIIRPPITFEESVSVGVNAELTITKTE